MDNYRNGEILALGKLVCTPVYKENMLELYIPLTVRYWWNGRVRGFTLPAGYKWDGASFPFGSKFDPEYLRASLIHDKFCNVLSGKETLHYEFSIEEISELFGEILKLDGVGYLHAEVMEAAVTVFKTLV